MIIFKGTLKVSLYKLQNTYINLKRNGRNSTQLFLSKKHHQIKVFLQFFFSSNIKFLFTKYYQALTFVKSLKGTKSEMAETLTLYSNWIVAFMDWV